MQKLAEYSLRFDEIKPKLIDNITFYSKIKPNQINQFISLAKSSEGIIDISCKHISWFEYINYDLRNLFKKEIEQIKNILQTPNIDEKIEEKVVWALECFPTMPSHNMEDLLNILYITKKYKIEDKWLVYNIDNIYYNSFLTFLQEYAGVQYIKVDLNKTYSCTQVHFIQPYHHFQEETLKYVHQNLIPKIKNKNDKLEVYKKIALIKTIQDSKANSPNRGLHLSESKKSHIETQHEIKFFENLKEDQKAYYIDNSDYLLVSWGASFFINYKLWCKDKKNKKVVVICHPDYEVEYRNYSNITSSGYYNFEGHIVKFITNIRDVSALTDQDLDFNPTESELMGSFLDCNIDILH